MAADEAVEEKSKRRRKRRSEITDAEAEEPIEENRGITERKGRATPGKRVQTSESSNIATRSLGGVRGYLAGVREELDKVIWPTREELIRLTRIVLAVMIASAIVLGIISFIFTEVFVLGIAEDNPIVFVVLFLGAGAGYYVLQRILQADHDPY